MQKCLLITATVIGVAAFGGEPPPEDSLEGAAGIFAAEAGPWQEDEIVHSPKAWQDDLNSMVLAVPGTSYLLRI
jgi:hypothetical protein